MERQALETFSPVRVVAESCSAAHPRAPSSHLRAEPCMEQLPLEGPQPHIRGHFLIQGKLASRPAPEHQRGANVGSQRTRGL